MTERTAKAVTRDHAHFAVGPSTVSWDGAALTIDIDEVCVPMPKRIKGRVRLWPSAMTTRSFELDPAGRHHWWPIAPISRVEAAFERPDLTWAGHGYLDANAGGEPLQKGFAGWNWSRASLADHAALLYEPIPRNGTTKPIAVRFDKKGRAEDFTPPPPVTLPGTLWGIKRATRAEPGGDVSVLQTLEDTPFYARSVLSTRLLGREAPAFHESLSLDRFASNWVKMLLPWRMPRRTF